MTLSLEALHPAIGARATGVDLTQPLNGGTVEAIREAWARHLVLVFSGQPLSDGQHIAFTRQLGELELLLQPDDRAPTAQEIFRVTNVDREGRLIPLNGSRYVRAQKWHTDSSFLPVPAMGSLLRGIEVPAEGGETAFANMFAAYAAMPEAMQARLEGVRGRYRFTFVRHGGPGGETGTSGPVEHPVVRRHADGRRSLYLSPAHLDGIVGMSPAASEAFVEETIGFATRPEFVYRHRWQPGDLVMWDNRGTLHRQLPFDHERERRIMHRTTLLGTEAVQA